MATREVPLPHGDAVLVTMARPGGTPQQNQDAAAALVHGDAGALVVADGVGSLAASGEASRLAVAMLLSGAEAPETENALRARIVDDLELCNQRVVSERAGGATVAVAALWQDRIRPIHAGDARLMLVGQRGRKVHVTTDHGPVGFAVAAGVLDDDDAQAHPERHLVSNVLGSHDMFLQVGPSLAMSPRDTLLLCSDGITDNVTSDELAEMIRTGDLSQVAYGLARVVRNRMASPGDTYKPDDASFILYRRR